MEKTHMLSTDMNVALDGFCADYSWYHPRKVFELYGELNPGIDKYRWEEITPLFIEQYVSLLNRMVERTGQAELSDSDMEVANQLVEVISNFTEVVAYLGGIGEVDIAKRGYKSPDGMARAMKDFYKILNK